MKLYLKNHTERYPVEQLQLQLFAQEPSEFCTEPFTGDGTVSSLSRGKHFLTATAKVTYRGRTGFASNRVRLEDAAQLLSRGHAGAGRRAPVGRALRRAADEAFDPLPFRRRQRKRRRAPAARDLFCLSGAGKALRRRLAAYHRGRQAA